jgi:hypothetical protein
MRGLPTLRSQSDGYANRFNCGLVPAHTGRADDVVYASGVANIFPARSRFETTLTARVDDS